MAENSSEQDCIDRHIDYPYDVRATEWSEFQQRRCRMVAARVRPGDVLLEVGCNSGYMVELVDPSCEVHGIDVSPRLVETAKTRLVTAQVAKAEAIPFPDKSVDVANLSEILEHVFDPELCMREASRVSRRSIIGSTPHESGHWGAHRVKGDRFHVRCYTEITLRAMLETFGRIVYFDTANGPTGFESSDGLSPSQPQCYVFEVEIS